MSVELSPQARRALTPQGFAVAILRGMQDKPMYGGTADPRAVQKRRAKNKAARKSRRLNRTR